MGDWQENPAFIDDVFFTDDNRHADLSWFKDNGQEIRVDVLVYCLMPMIFICNSTKRIGNIWP